MELAEIISRLEFLESERRKSKTALTSVEKHIESLELNQNGLRESIKTASGASNGVVSLTERIDLMEEMVQKLRADLLKTKKVSESQTKAGETQEKLQSAEIGAMKKELAKVAKETSAIKEIKKAMIAQKEETTALASNVANLKINIERNDLKIDEATQVSRTYVSMQKRDAKRAAEIQAQFEITQNAIEEQISRLNLANDTIRKLDAKLANYQAKESERQQSLVRLIDQAKLQQVDQDNQWKEWENRFSEIESNGESLQTKLLTLEVMLKDLKKVQSTFGELNEKLDRRINEITEMQRLGDDRIRKEWMNFKSDDQKRWTAYTLAQEELRRGTGSEVTGTKDRLQTIDDDVTQIKTMLRLLGDENQRQMRAIVDVVNNMLEANDRTLGKLEKK